MRHARRRCSLLIFGVVSRAFDAADDSLGVGSVLTTQLFDGGLHALQRMLSKQLQNPNVLPHAGTGSMPIFKPLTKFREHRRQRPLPVDVRVIQRRRSASQRDQIMQWIEDLIAVFVTAGMPGHDRVVMHDLHAIDVAFDCHTLKRTVPRHAVTDVVEAGQLILVDLRGFANTRIEPMQWQLGRLDFLLGEPRSDRLRLAAAAALPFLFTTRPQIPIEFCQVLHLGHRRRPLPLQRLDAVLDHRLLVALRRQTVQRLEHVMTRQRRIPRIRFAITTGENRRRHGLRIVPPDLFGNTAEEVKRLHHTFQNRFGPLCWQRDRKRRVRVRPDQNQHVDLATTIREIHRDFAEVGLDPLAGCVIERNECLALIITVPNQKPPHG